MTLEPGTTSATLRLRRSPTASTPGSPPARATACSQIAGATLARRRRRLRLLQRQARRPPAPDRARADAVRHPLRERPARASSSALATPSAWSSDAQGPSDVYGVFLDEYLTKVARAQRRRRLPRRPGDPQRRRLPRADRRPRRAPRTAATWPRPTSASRASATWRRASPTRSTRSSRARRSSRSRRSTSCACGCTGRRCSAATEAQRNDDRPTRTGSRRCTPTRRCGRPTRDARLDDDSTVQFEGRHDARMKTDHPAVKQAFGEPGRRLAGVAADRGAHDRQRRPRRRPPGAARRPRVGPGPAVGPRTTDRDATLDRPTVYDLARIQAAAGDDAVTNLQHERIPIGRRRRSSPDRRCSTARATEPICRQTLPDDDRLDASLDRLADLALLVRRPTD